MKGDKKRKGKKKPARDPRDAVSQIVNVYVTRKQAQQKQNQLAGVGPKLQLAPIQYMPRQGYAFEPLIKPATAQVAPADNRLETLLRQMEERMKPIEVKAKQEAKQEAEPTREMIAEAQSSSVGGESSGGETSGGPTASSARRDLAVDLVHKYGRPDLLAQVSRDMAIDIARQLGETIKTKEGRKTKKVEQAREELAIILENERERYGLRKP
jgi:hypothetical protein